MRRFQNLQVKLGQHAKYWSFHFQFYVKEDELTFQCDSDEDEGGSEEEEERSEEEEESSKEEERAKEPSSTSQKTDDSPTGPDRSSYSDGVQGLASVVAFRLKSVCPELSASGAHICKLPQWVEPYAKRGRCCPSAKFKDAAQVMDRIFYSMHKDGIFKKKGVRRMFEEKAQAANLDIDKRAIRLFGWLRLCVRMRCLNLLKWKTKDTVLLVNQKAKKDKNSRASKKINHWLS
jgi:hypothetical protein